MESESKKETEKKTGAVRGAIDFTTDNAGAIAIGAMGAGLYKVGEVTVRKGVDLGKDLLARRAARKVAEEVVEEQAQGFFGKGGWKLF